VHFASPIFLLALLPWAALLLWLLLGKRRRVNVPFLELWKGPVTGPTARRRIGMPPLALAAALAALLLMILAAARPAIPRSTSRNQIPIIIVIDHGLTMSVGKPPRFAALSEEFKPLIRDQFGNVPAQIVSVPATESPTAIDTRDLLEPAVRQQLELNPTSPVIVLTDQQFRVFDKRRLRIAPQGKPADISIAHISARISPLAQLMLTLRNQSPAKKMMLHVLCDNRQTAEQEVDLPPNGTTRDYFLPIDASAKQIRAQIEVIDDFIGDNTAYLVRRGSWPAIEPRTPLFAELQRLIEKYSKLRPPSDQSKRLAIVSALDAGADPQIILANIAAPAIGDVTMANHPITISLQNVDWKKLASAGLTEPIGDDWKPLVQIAGKTAIAIRDTPSRQLWMGLQTQSIANTPEFVILWSNILDWVGQGGEEFTAQETGNLDNSWTAPPDYPPGLKPGWWPGIYRRSDGTLLAVNAPDVPIPPAASTDWKSKLTELANEHRQAHSVNHLATPLILASLALMVLAALTWRGGLKKIRQTQESLNSLDAHVTL
jgi:hypothetical protein